MIKGHPLKNCRDQLQKFNAKNLNYMCSHLIVNSSSRHRSQHLRKKKNSVVRIGASMTLSLVNLLVEASLAMCTLRERKRANLLSQSKSYTSTSYLSRELRTSSVARSRSTATCATRMLSSSTDSSMMTTRFT